MGRQRGDSGYREVDHTADRRLEIWGPDLASLFAAAAQGMYAICRPEIDASRQVTRDVHVEGADRESLLVGFLSELLFRLEAESTVFDGFDLSFEEEALCCTASGHTAIGLEDEIKAVTWEDVFVEVEPKSGTIRAAVTFDI